MLNVINWIRPFSFRGKHRLLTSCLPTGGSRDARIHGAEFTLDLADFIQRSIYLGTFETAEAKLARSRLRPGMTFVDIGANVGYFTALAAQAVGGSGRVIAFEPSPYAFARLAQMVKRNEFWQVTALPMGLSDRGGELELYLGANSHNHTPTMVKHAGAVASTVPVRTLDDVLEEQGIDRVDLLKIDVEGYEGKVLEGARRSLAAGVIRAILCEFNEYWLNQAGTNSKEITTFLRSFSFRPPVLIGRSDNVWLELAEGPAA